MLIGNLTTVITLLVAAVFWFRLSLADASSFGAHDIRKDYFTEKERADGDHLHEIIVAVKKLNMDKVEEILMDVSDPHSPNYGKHLTRDEVGKIYANPKGTKEVLDYLSKHEVVITQQTLMGEYIRAVAPIRTWESMFSNQFYLYHHVDGMRKPVVRALHLTLDDAIADHVADVMNIVDLPLEFKSSPVLRMSKDTTKEAVTPSLLNSYYNIFTNNGSMYVTQNIYSASGQYFSSKDLAEFQKNYGIPNHAVDADPNNRNNPNKCAASIDNCAESNLDLQYIMAIAQNVNTSITYDSTQNVFFSWIMNTASQIKPASVQSISYGNDETFLRDNGARYYMKHFDDNAIILGTMGVTIVVASGDDGAAPSSARSAASKCKYAPSYPATSQYVTAVGGTQRPESGSPEIACSTATEGGATSGGGFSVLGSAPSYQRPFIKNYFAKVATQPVSGYNKTGRGIPDVSLMADNYQVVINGSTYGLSGTSASAPVFAGMISLINSARQKQGRPTVGFINPTLYASSGSFANDITSGNNKCTSNPKICCSQGFYTATGWDPVTGFGSVDFTKLYNLFMLTTAPTQTPTQAPSIPTSVPTASPTMMPLSKPVTAQPTTRPSRSPSMTPTVTPTMSPTVKPSVRPTSIPSPTPTRGPVTARPTEVPTLVPTQRPSVIPTSRPTTYSPTRKPTPVPSTARPSSSPTSKPTTRTPTTKPTPVPSTARPSSSPTSKPTTYSPTKKPTPVPSTARPSSSPTSKPTTRTPTTKPTPAPSTARPSSSPTSKPTLNPTSVPTVRPSGFPTSKPITRTPTRVPTKTPTQQPAPPTRVPTRAPSSPSLTPSVSPSASPTVSPTVNPSATPTQSPTVDPTVTQQ